MAISKRLRFEVFKRDKFTCQYCGKKAPDVVLHADHIEPKSKGGADTLLNLVTACAGCNLGKSDKRLSDDSAVVKQRSQLEDLQERQEQIAMMVEWQRSLAGMESQEIDEAAKFWNDLISPWALSAHGRRHIRRLINAHGLAAVMDAMRVSASSYIKVDQSGEPDRDSVEHAYQKIGGVCRVRAAEKDKPWLREVFYIRAIIKNRFYYVNPPEAKKLLERAFTAGAKADVLRDIATQERNWTNWTAEMWDYIGELEGEDDA